MSADARVHAVPPSAGADVPPRVDGTVRSLLVFAVLYAVTVVVSPHWWWAALAMGAATLIAVLGRAFGPGRPRRRSIAAMRAVQLSAVAEGISLVVGVVIGLATGMWWMVLPLLLSTVAVHMVCLAVAFRRPIDLWSAAWMTIAAVIAWAGGPSSWTWSWSLGGVVAAGVCAGYVLALTRRASTPAPSLFSP